MSWVHAPTPNGFESRVEFSVHLPAGDLDVHLKSWHRFKGTARIRVSENGGGEVLLQIK